MGVTEIRQEIVGHEASIEKQKQAFTAQRQQIVDAIKPFVKEHLKSEVENQVRTRPCLKNKSCTILQDCVSCVHGNKKA